MTRIEILADAADLEKEYVEFASEVKIIRPSEAIEAMKTAMKQAYIAGQNSIKMTDHTHQIDADEYIKQLEEQK